MDFGFLINELDELSKQWGGLCNSMQEEETINYMLWEAHVNAAIDCKDWETLKYLSKNKERNFFTAEDHEGKSDEKSKPIIQTNKGVVYIAGIEIPVVELRIYQDEEQ